MYQDCTVLFDGPQHSSSNRQDDNMSHCQTQGDQQLTQDKTCVFFVCDIAIASGIKWTILTNTCWACLDDDRAV